MILEVETDIEPVVRAIAAVDGFAPINDQALIDVRSGERTGYLWLDGDTVLGVAAATDTDAELALVPEFRGRGLGALLIAAVRSGRHIETAWAHGDHPAAAALAAQLGFDRDRTLYRLEMPLPESGTAPRFGGRTLRSFNPDTDVEAWVALNARIFRDHPEQGAITAADVRARMGEAWFDPDNFLVLAESDGSLVGYNWLKVVPGERDGEIYVIGVDDSVAGQGLGRALMTAGLARFRDLGLTTTSLYVDDSNPGALALYRSLGYATDTVDVQYRRRASADA